MGKKKSKSLGLDQWQTFTTNVEQKEWLASESAATGIPVSVLIRRAIQAAMDAQKRGYHG